MKTDIMLKLEKLDRAIKDVRNRILIETAMYEKLESIRKRYIAMDKPTSAQNG